MSQPCCSSDMNAASMSYAGRQRGWGSGLVWSAGQAVLPGGISRAEPWPGRGPSKGGGQEAAMAARGVPGLIAVAALMGLAACGSVSAGSAGHPAPVSAGSSRTPAAAAGTPAGGARWESGGRQQRDAQEAERSQSGSLQSLSFRPSATPGARVMAADGWSYGPESYGMPDRPQRIAGRTRLLLRPGSSTEPAVPRPR